MKKRLRNQMNGFVKNESISVESYQDLFEPDRITFFIYIKRKFSDSNEYIDVYFFTETGWTERDIEIDLENYIKQLCNVQKMKEILIEMKTKIKKNEKNI